MVSSAFRVAWTFGAIDLHVSRDEKTHDLTRVALLRSAALSL